MARVTGTSQTSSYTGVDLRAAIQAIQAAGNANNLQGLAYSVANALSKIQADSQVQNFRMRDLGQSVSNDASQPAKLLVSSDRIVGGLAISGGLPAVQPTMSLNLFFDPNLGPVVQAQNNQTGQLLPLTLEGTPVQVVGGPISANIEPASIIHTPQAVAYNVGTQSIPSGVATKLTFDTNYTSFPSGMHTVGTGDFVTPQAGWYLISGTVAFGASAAGTIRQIEVYSSGVQLTPRLIVNSPPLPTVAFPTVVSVCMIVLSGGFDTFQFWAYQDSGGPLVSPTNVNSGAVRYLSLS